MAVLTDKQREAGWTVVKLGDIATVVTGQTPSKKFPEHWGEKGEIPFLTPKDQAIGIRLVDTERYISREYSDIYKKRIVPEGAVALTCIGSLGKISVVQTATLTNQQINSIVPDGSKANNLYIYYYLMSSYDSLESLAGGTVMPIVNKSSLEGMEIPLPPLKEQERIAGILGSLDDKIEANTRLIQTIKEYMTALYKAEAKNGKVLELTDIADFVNGRAFTKDATGTGRVVIRIAELNNGLGASTVYNDIEVKEENTAYPGDVLMSWSGSLDTYVWHLPEAIINQHIFKVIPKGNYPKWLVYHACKSVIEDFQAIAVDKATTMGHIRRGDLKRDISIPAREMPQMENLWNLWMNLEQENLQLAETRDALIKRLIG